MLRKIKLYFLHIFCFFSATFLVLHVPIINDMENTMEIMEIMKIACQHHKIIWNTCLREEEKSIWATFVICTFFYDFKICFNLLVFHGESQSLKSLEWPINSFWHLWSTGLPVYWSSCLLDYLSTDLHIYSCKLIKSFAEFFKVIRPSPKGRPLQECPL